MTKHAVVLLALATLSACNPSAPADAGPPADAALDSTSAADSGPTEDVGPVTSLNGCSDARFVDRSTGTADDRMVMVPLGTTSFDQPCLSIRAGQSVMFMWDFTEYPLVPGVAPSQTGAGTEPTPIAERRTGDSYTVSFANAGDYPYYSPGTYAAGMLGVVRVLP